MSVFQFCLHGLSPGDCTMAIQLLEDNHQYFTKKINYCLYEIKIVF